MLKIQIPDTIEVFDEKTETFKYIKGGFEMQLEHSLISLAKWESRWHKPFLSKKPKTDEESRDYIRCMTLTNNVNPELYKFLPSSLVRQIYAYIEDPMTATWFSKEQEKKAGVGNREIVTAEIIYYWMVTLQIPVQFEKWHLNRLLTLIKVINIKNAPKQNMKEKDLLARNARLNKARRAKHHTRG